MTHFVTVATNDSPIVAESAKMSLALEGIEGTLLNVGVVTMDWLLMNAVGGIQLQVEGEDVVQASEMSRLRELSTKEKPRVQSTHLIRFARRKYSAPLELSGERRGGVETCEHCGEYVDLPEVSDGEMIEKELTLDPAVSIPEAPARRILLLLEPGCILLLVYLPFIGSALYCFGLSCGTFYFEDEVADTSTFFSVVAPILLIVYARNVPWSRFGIKPPRWLVDPLLALGLWFVETFECSFASLLLTSRPFESWEYAERGGF